MRRERRWSPALDGRKRLLRGPSAKGMLPELEWGSNVGLILLAILVVGMLVRGSGYGGSRILTVVMMLILLDVFYLGIVVVRMSVRKRREVRAGYTTVTNEFPRVDQIDPTTGRIIRLAGEETLDRDEYLRRMTLIREVIDAERLDSTRGGVESPPGSDLHERP